MSNNQEKINTKDTKGKKTSIHEEHLYLWYTVLRTVQGWRRHERTRIKFRTLEVDMKRKILYKNGVALSFAEYGDKHGYPILIQHGLIASIDDQALFEGLIQLNTRLVCIARPGYGESSPYIMKNLAEWGDMVAPLIHELGITQFDVLAMSSGAPYGYSIGSRFPDKVRNIYIFSGIPALYDEVVRSDWPYTMAGDKSMAEIEALAHELIFSNLTRDDLARNDIRDSSMHNAFGVAQDLMLRCKDWGFRLSDVKEKVFMRHSKQDDSVPYKTAVRSAELLPNCELELTETGPHFSDQALDDFIRTTIGKEIRRLTG
jgi:pimeloyl-ACP methyl ester carboxylesterase